MKNAVRRTLAVMTALLAVACKRTGTVEGNVTLTMQSGEVRKGVSSTVYLLRNGDSIAQAVDAVCNEWKTTESGRMTRAKDFDARAERFKRASERAPMRTQVALYDSVDKYRAAAAAERQTENALSSNLDRIQAMVRAAADTQVPTDIEARYRIGDITPGKYVVYAEWPSDQTYLFWAPIEVGKGDDKTQNLDRATLAMSKLRCQ